MVTVDSEDSLILPEFSEIPDLFLGSVSMAGQDRSNLGTRRSIIGRFTFQVGLLSVDLGTVLST
jgi:hypothetical protein